MVRGKSRVPSREVVRGREVSVVSDRPQPRQLDGDVIDPAERLDVSVRPDALHVCVYHPEESEDLTRGAPGNR